MSPPDLAPFATMINEVGHTLAKVLRSHLHTFGPSWADVRDLIEKRFVLVDGTVCTDSARRLKEGEVITLLKQKQQLPTTATPDGLVVRHLDEHVVVVEKPAGLNTVRHPSELEWSEKRKGLVPTLQDVTQWAIAKQKNLPNRKLPPLRIVHRLDKETSGLICFARSPLAERSLGMQFRKHTVVRRYLALVAGKLTARTIRTHLVRDRGDGRRGSTPLPKTGKLAITHIQVAREFQSYTLLSCQLETGRTHQIRIHLSELGHPVCGDKVYHRKPDGTMISDNSGAPRLALHAAELGFRHPVSDDELHWEMPLPKDLVQLIDRLSVGREPKTSG